jgi:hypothetical protein
MQLDEVLAQQDFVEAEHVEKIMATEKVTNEKDIIIADLGAQVAYAYAREQEVDATHKQLAVHLACVEEEAAQAKEESWRRQKLLMTSSWRARPHAPLMLAHYWRVLDDPLEERLQSRTSGLLPPCYPLSTEASTTPAHHYTLVIKTSAVIFPKQQWPPRTTQQPRRQ